MNMVFFAGIVLGLVVGFELGLYCAYRIERGLDADFPRSEK